MPFVIVARRLRPGGFPRVGRRRYTGSSGSFGLCFSLCRRFLLSVAVVGRCPVAFAGQNIMQFVQSRVPSENVPAAGTIPVSCFGEGVVAYAYYAIMQWVALRPPPSTPGARVGSVPILFRCWFRDPGWYTLVAYCPFA